MIKSKSYFVNFYKVTFKLRIYALLYVFGVMI